MPIPNFRGVASFAHAWHASAKRRDLGVTAMMSGLTLPVTLSAAAACAFINFWLAMRIVKIRTAEKINIGDGGNERLIARMRAHLNFAEYAPIVLILLALTEFAWGATIGLWAAAVLFVVARIAHPIGMDGWIPARAVGVALTMATMLGLAIYAIVILTTGGTPDVAIDLPPAMG